MAMAGAIIGPRVAGVEVDDIAATTKTLPSSLRLWAEMVGPGQGGPPERRRGQRARRATGQGSGGRAGDYDESDVKVRLAGVRAAGPRPVLEHADAECCHGGQFRGRWGVCWRRRFDRRIRRCLASSAAIPIAVEDDGRGR